MEMTPLLRTCDIGLLLMENIECFEEPGAAADSYTDSH